SPPDPASGSSAGKQSPPTPATARRNEQRARNARLGGTVRRRAHGAGTSSYSGKLPDAEEVDAIALLLAGRPVRARIVARGCAAKRASPAKAHAFDAVGIGAAQTAEGARGGNRVPALRSVGDGDADHPLRTVRVHRTSFGAVGEVRLIRRSDARTCSARALLRVQASLADVGGTGAERCQRRRDEIGGHRVDPRIRRLLGAADVAVARDADDRLDSAAGYEGRSARVSPAWLRRMGGYLKGERVDRGDDRGSDPLGPVVTGIPGGLAPPDDRHVRSDGRRARAERYRCHRKSLREDEERGIVSEGHGVERGVRSKRGDRHRSRRRARRRADDDAAAARGRRRDAVRGGGHAVRSDDRAAADRQAGWIDDGHDPGVRRVVTTVSDERREARGQHDQPGAHAYMIVATLPGLGVLSRAADPASRHGQLGALVSDMSGPYQWVQCSQLYPLAMPLVTLPAMYAPFRISWISRAESSLHS